MPTGCFTRGRSRVSVDRSSYTVNFPGATIHERVRPRQSQQWRSPVGRKLQQRRRPSMASSSRERPPISPTAAITRRSTIPSARTPTFTARWAASRSVTPTAPRGPARSHRPCVYLQRLAATKFLTDIVYPGSTTTTAYGIWYNGGTSYTICGGYSSNSNASEPIGNAYLVDYDSATGQFTNWTSFAYPNGVVGQDYDHAFPGHQQHRSRGSIRSAPTRARPARQIR